MQGQNLIMVSEDNLILMAEQIAARLHEKKSISKYCLPEEAEKLLNLKKQAILKLWKAKKIDVAWTSAKTWLVSRQSIDQYLDSKLNYNIKK